MATAKSVRESLAAHAPFTSEDNPFKVLDELVGPGNWSLDEGYTEAHPTVNAVGVSLIVNLTVDRPKKEIKEGESDTEEIVSTGTGIVVWNNPVHTTIQLARRYAIFEALVGYGASFIPDPDPEVQPVVNNVPAYSIPQVVSTTPSDPLPQPVAQTPRPTLPSASKPANAVTCGNPDSNAQCMGTLSPYTGKPKPDGTPGKFMSVATQAEMTSKKYGVPLCKNCNSFRFMQERGYTS